MKKYIVFIVLIILLIISGCEEVKEPVKDMTGIEFEVNSTSYLSKPTVYRSSPSQELRYFYEPLAGEYYRDYDEFYTSRSGTFAFTDSYDNSWDLVEPAGTPVGQGQYKVVQDAFYGTILETTLLIDSYLFSYSWCGTAAKGSIRRTEGVCFKSYNKRDKITDPGFYSTDSTSDTNRYERYVYTYTGDYGDLSSDYKYSWNKDIGDWELIERIDYDVKSNGDLLTMEVFRGNRELVLEERYVYTVDSYGDTLMERFYMVNSGTPALMRTTNYTYGPDDIDYGLIKENAVDVVSLDLTSMSEIRYIYEQHGGYWDIIGEIFFNDDNYNQKIELSEANSYIRYRWNTEADKVAKKEYFFNDNTRANTTMAVSFSAVPYNIRSGSENVFTKGDRRGYREPHID